MSKVGKKPIILPEGVSTSLENNKLLVKGPKGSLETEFGGKISVKLEDKQILVEKAENGKQSAALWGLTRALIANMVLGVTQGFGRELELQGSGYRMNLKGKQIEFALGFSHPVVIDIPAGIEVAIERNILTIKGIDKRLVGQFTANIRALKEVEPYKGKGFRYVGEQVRKKEGKKTVASGE